MVCPPVRGDNPRALASGLSYVQVDTFVNMAWLFHTPYTSVDLAYQELFRAKTSKGSIKLVLTRNRPQAFRQSFQSTYK